MTDRSQRFDRLPADEDRRAASGEGDDERGAAEGSEDADDRELPTREAVLSFWEDRYGVPRSVFAEYTFWERGKGKLWAFRGDAPSPVPIQGLGATFLRTRQEHWKPTTDAVQRFGRHATDCVIHLDEDEARAFVAGEDQDVDWDGDWGYLIVAHDLAGEPEPIGVGLFLHGELRSQIPKGRRREF